MIESLLFLTAIGTQGRLTIEAPGLVRPFAAVSATRWGGEVETTFRAGMETGRDVRVSLGALTTDLERDDADGRTWAAVEVTWAP